MTAPTEQPMPDASNVWVVTIDGRINSVWADGPAAEGHVARLIEVNGDQIAPIARLYQVRS